MQTPQDEFQAYLRDACFRPHNTVKLTLTSGFD